MTNKEILENKIGDTTIQEMSTLTFLGWITKKINGVERKSSVINELTMLISNPPLSRKMPDDEKVKIVNKLIGLNVKIK